MTTTGRVLAVLVTVVVVLGSVPAPVLAADESPFPVVTAISYGTPGTGAVIPQVDADLAVPAVFGFTAAGSATTVAVTNRGPSAVGFSIADGSGEFVFPEPGEREGTVVEAGATTRVTVPLPAGERFYVVVLGFVGEDYVPLVPIPVDVLLTRYASDDPTEPNDLADERAVAYGETTAASIAHVEDDDEFHLLTAGGRTRLVVTNDGVGPLLVTVRRSVGQGLPFELVVGEELDDGRFRGDPVAPGTTRTFTFPTAGELHVVSFASQVGLDYEFRLELLDNDRLEPNDRPSQAEDLAPGRYEDLLLPAGDGDLYGVSLAAGDAVTATVTFDGDAPATGGAVLLEIAADGTQRVLARGPIVDDEIRLGYTAHEAPAGRTVLLVAAGEPVGYALDLAYGPSAVPLDRFEPNDDGNVSLATLPTGTTEGLTLTAGDDDLYLLELVAGTEVTVRARTTGGDAVPTLLVVDGEGTLVGDADAVEDVAATTFPVTATGTHVVAVSALDPTRTGTYVLEVEQVPGTTPERPGDDRFEPNDITDGVTPLTPGTYPGLSVAGTDVDAFLVDVAAGELFVAGAAFAPDETTPTLLTLLELDGTLVEQSRGQGSVSLAFDATGAPGGQYVLVLDPVDDPPDAPVEKPYTLSVATYPENPDDDRLEPNDGTGPGDLTVLGPGTETGLVAGPFANDVYGVEAAPGARVTLSVSYDPRAGSLSVVWLAPNGSVVGGPVVDGAGGVTATADDSGGALFVVGGAAGTVDFVTYDLTVTVADDPGNGTGGDGEWDDRFEPNDRPGEETPLAPGTYADLRITGADVDAFALELAAGDLLTAVANFSTADADLDLALLAPGGTLVADAVSTTDDETLRYVVPAGAGGTYVLLVEAFRGEGDAVYALSVDVEPSPVPADRFEPNDLAPTPLLPGSYDDLTVTPDDVDPYGVDLSAGQRLDVAVTFSYADADLDVFVYAPNGSLVAEGVSETDDETASVLADATGRYVVVVEAFDAPRTAAYALELRVSDGGDGDGDDDGGDGDGDGGDGDGGDGDDGDGDGGVPTVPESPFDGPLPGMTAAGAPLDHDGDGLFEDVNGDGVGDLDDVFDLAFGLAGLGSLTPEQVAALDFDADGDVDLDDVFELAFR